MEAQKAKVIVDKRERGFASLLTELGAEVEEKMLEVGDFLCSGKTVIERKTRGDFEASVLDQRLFQQLGNLRSNYENVIIVVEGERLQEGSLSHAALMGAYATVMTDFGASLFFTRSDKATAELIYFIAKHEQLGKKVEMRISAKRKTLTLSQTMRSVVEMFPMVGPSMAKKLLIHFGGLEMLFRASEQELMQVEGLGEKKAKAIWRTIHQPYNPEED
ncbi:3'-flap repair endonuclease Xpf [uncultured archaeon]|nr:3'-flap repair endonuclease Xpf [uncultured archaeon]